MRKTPYVVCMPLPFLGLLCIGTFFVLKTIDTAPIREFKTELERQTEIEKARMTSERELYDHRMETGVIEPFEKLIISGYVDNPNYPPPLKFTAIDPDTKTMIYDEWGMCVGFAQHNQFHWKHTGRGETDACRGVRPIETVQTRRRQGYEEQQPQQ